MSGSPKPDALTDALTDALLDALTPAVAAVFREEADRFVRGRVRDSVRALAAHDPDLAEGLLTTAHVQGIIEPPVAELISRSPGRDYIADAAGELLGVMHAELLNVLTEAIRRPPPAASPPRKKRSTARSRKGNV